MINHQKAVYYAELIKYSVIKWLYSKWMFVKVVYFYNNWQNSLLQNYMVYMTIITLYVAYIYASEVEYHT